MPGAPGAPVCSEVTGNSVKLTWTPPTDDGGAEIFNYVIQKRREDESDWSKATEEDIADLVYNLKGNLYFSRYLRRILSNGIL